MSTNSVPRPDGPPCTKHALPAIHCGAISINSSKQIWNWILEVSSLRLATCMNMRRRCTKPHARSGHRNYTAKGRWMPSGPPSVTLRLSCQFKRNIITYRFWKRYFTSKSYSLLSTHFFFWWGLAWLYCKSLMGKYRRRRDDDALVIGHAGYRVQYRWATNISNVQWQKNHGGKFSSTVVSNTNE